jgi:hypothetical protein
MTKREKQNGKTYEACASFHGWCGVGNPKPETNKSETHSKSKSEMSNTPVASQFGALDISSFEFVSDFEFRISDLCFVSGFGFRFFS